MLLAAMMLAGIDVSDLDRAFADARSAEIFASAPARERRSRGFEVRLAISTDIDALTTTCSAARRSGEPEIFLVRVAHAYGMTGAEARELRKDCRTIAGLRVRR